MVAGAMLDRLLHRSVVFNIGGDSYRMRSHRARAEANRRAVAEMIDYFTSVLHLPATPLGLLPECWKV
jgi:hypothetical protein